MSRIFQSSGDLIADRRYEYAQAAAAEGDHGAAEEMLAQTLELTPRWAPAWFALGEARLALKNEQGAREAFARCCELDADDEQGARVALAAMNPAEPDAKTIAMTASYVRNLFDQYAERFDSHLTKHLAYRGPELIHDALTRACATEGVRLPFERALDLGCGTGLFGEAVEDMARAVDGVDLSPRMIRMARKRGCYDKLAAGDMGEFLAAASPGRYDLVAAADVFVYVGDLQPTFAAVARALKPRGLFAFSIQRGDGADYALGPDRRFSHAVRYVESCVRGAGLTPTRIEETSTRMEKNEPTPGAIVIAMKRR